MTLPVLTLTDKAPEQDVWEFNRQQNIIDSIEGSAAAGKYGAEDTLDYATAMKRRNEAWGIQNFLVKKNLVSEDVNDAVDAVDAAWVAKNPPPVTDEPDAPVESDEPDAPVESD